jgi:hypothetical protein
MSDIGMTFEEFQNELPGNRVAWRVVFNEYSSRYFVYRRIDRGDGYIISEYLQGDGTVDMNCADGWFPSFLNIGLALAAHDALITHAGHAHTPSYHKYLARFTADESNNERTDS